MRTLDEFERRFESHREEDQEAHKERIRGLRLKERGKKRKLEQRQ